MRAPEIDIVKQTLKAPGSIEEKARMLAPFRKHAEASQRMDEHLIAEVMRVDRDMSTIHREHERLRATLEQMTRPPLFPATFLSRVSQGLIVMLPGGARRVVTYSDEFDPGSLCAGDDVLLNPDLNLVVAATETGQKGGEVGTFDRMLSTRIVLRHRDEEFVVEPVAQLLAESDSLKSGDLVRFDRHTMLAFELLPQSKHDHFFRAEPPKATFGDIGGLDKQIEEIKSLLTLRFFHPEKASSYGLTASGTLLLEGPPGTGKTLLASALAHWVGELSGGGATWISVQPGQFRNEYYGVSERLFRECFQAARTASQSDRRLPSAGQSGNHPPVVLMFFDELDAIGSTRGKFGSQVDDRVMQAFAAELDGVNAAGNILVIGATNRRQALDPCLVRPGRFGDKVIQVPRPNINAARGILGRHLAPDCPIYCNGHGAPAAAREAILDAAISRLYSPNGASSLGKLFFRDATVREVKAPDLISGASLANIARGARERACWREVANGKRGVSLEDVLAAIDRELDSLSRLLTPHNVRDHITGLPDDVDVVKVERPAGSRANAVHKYLTLP
jgi:proteasome-associated ATPase